MIESADNLRMPSIAILSGGLATRLKPITTTLPKSMVLVAGEPFVAHQLRMLARQGFRTAVLLCGFLGEQIQDYVGNGRRFGIEVSYSFDGDVLRGTGGAIRRALPLLGSQFMVVYGDSWCPTNYRSIWEFFRASGKQGLMTVFENNNQWDKSNVVFNEGRIIEYDKSSRNPSMRHIDYGVGAYTSSVFEPWNSEAVFDLSTVQRQLLDSGNLAGFLVHERFYEIGSPSGLQETDKMISSNLLNSETASET